MARQLAYAPTHDLTHADAWQWHDDLMGCIADCVAIFRDKAAAAGLDHKVNATWSGSGHTSTVSARAGFVTKETHGAEPA